MAHITASLVKELRDKTGAGMMDCKKALAESDGDVEGAVDWLRKKGLAAGEHQDGLLELGGDLAEDVDGLRLQLVELTHLVVGVRGWCTHAGLRPLVKTAGDMLPAVRRRA